MSGRHGDPEWIWFAGGIRPWQAANVHFWSEAVLRCASVFEGIKGYWRTSENRHFLLNLPAHLTRLEQSCRLMRIPNEFDRAQLENAISDLISALAYRTDIYIRPTVYLADAGEPAELCVAAFSIREEPAESLHCGFSSLRKADSTSHPSLAKAAASYSTMRLARLEAADLGWDDAILLNSNGYVAEATGANVFVVRGGSVCTPDLDSAILEGTLRETVFRLCAALDIPVQTVPKMTTSDVLAADEIFLTGTLQEVARVGTLAGGVPRQHWPFPVISALRSGLSEACRGTAAIPGVDLTPGPVIA